MSNQLQVILDEQNVAVENAKQLLDAFGAPFTEAGDILATYESIKVTSEDDFAAMAEARDKRLALKRIRTGVENKRKELKDGIVKTGRAIDSVARFVKETIEPAEKYLESQEKYAEIKAAERAAALKAERVEMLAQFTDDVSLYNFESMTDEQFDQLLATLKAQKDAEVAAAKKAEAERLAAIEAEEKRQAEIQAENARLRAEAEEREKAAAKERAVAEEKLRVEREKAAEIQRQKDAEIAKEREKLAAIEKEKQAVAAREAQAKADEEEQQRKALLAPDKEKLVAFADVIDGLTMPNVANREAGKLLDETKDFLDRISKNLRQKAKSL